MPPPFRQINRVQFAGLLQQFNFSRQINAVHFHHTSTPNHGNFNGHPSVVAMFRHHTQIRGFRDIAQHLTIAPDGTMFLGRNWNLAPASAVGNNGNSFRGPFMFETVGNFNVGSDPFRDPQRLTVLTVIALVQRRFGLPSMALRFHREMANTDCPGSSLNKSTIIQAVNSIQPNADDAGVLNIEAIAETLTEQEIALNEAFDINEVLREFEAAVPETDKTDDEVSFDEEDTHEEMPEDFFQ